MIGYCLILNQILFWIQDLPCNLNRQEDALQKPEPGSEHGLSRRGEQGRPERSRLHQGSYRERLHLAAAWSQLDQQVSRNTDYCGSSVCYAHTLTHSEIFTGLQ